MVFFSWLVEHLALLFLGDESFTFSTSKLRGRYYTESSFYTNTPCRSPVVTNPKPKPIVIPNRHRTKYPAKNLFPANIGGTLMFFTPLQPRYQISGIVPLQRFPH
jgi:hypothetical protein